MPVTRDALHPADHVVAHFLSEPPERLGVGVSGGSDSLALLHLLTDWGGAELHVVTVDHGLRPEAVEEAQFVAGICKGLNLPHDTLEWRGWDGQGNLPEAAREARYRLMAEWAKARGIADIALGHTADDQAETLLMRLARRAGLDGLAAMSARRQMHAVTFHRPMLRLTRGALQSVLRARGQRWADDPTNADSAFRRVRARQALQALAPLGLTAEGLTQSAHHLAEARATLAHYAAREADSIATFQCGDILLERRAFVALRPDIARRILGAALHWIAGEGHGPRGTEMDTALDAMGMGQKVTLHGCLISSGGAHIRIAREYAAVRDLRCDPAALWDGRWHVEGPEIPGAELRALGPEGRLYCPDWRDSGLPRASVEATPAVWRDDTLIAAPSAMLPNGWTAELRRKPTVFTQTLLSH